MIRVVFGKAGGFYPEGSQEGRVIDGFQVFIRHSTRLIPGWPRMLRCSTFVFHPATTALAILFPTFF